MFSLSEFANSLGEKPTEITVVEKLEDYDKFKEDEQGQCVFCVGDIQDAVLLPCGHVFCEVCLVQWSNINRTCPICKNGFEYFLCSIKSAEDFQSRTLKPFTSRPSWMDKILKRGIEFAKSDTSSEFPFSPSHHYRKFIYLHTLKPSHLSYFEDQKKPQKFRPPDKIQRSHFLEWLKRELQTIFEQRDITTILVHVFRQFDGAGWDANNKEFQRHMHGIMFECSPAFVREIQSFFFLGATNVGDYDSAVKYIKGEAIDIERPSSSSSSSLSSSSSSSNRFRDQPFVRSPEASKIERREVLDDLDERPSVLEVDLSETPRKKKKRSKQRRMNGSVPYPYVERTLVRTSDPPPVPVVDPVLISENSFDNDDQFIDLT